jgi:hypothetical protein
MSALLTTTMTYMKTVIDGFEAAGRGHIKMAIGGAPISQMFADEIGADGYGQNASAAVDLFLRLARGEAAPAAPAKTIAPTGGDVDTGRPGKISTYKVLYWQEVPSQFKVSDDAGNEVNVELPSKFAERIDVLAHQRGFQNSDAYLEHWKWSEEQERPGSAKDVAAALKAELEAAAKW